MQMFWQSVQEKPGLFVAIGLYLLLMILVGMWARKLSMDAQRTLAANSGGVRGFMEEYFLAGRGLGGFTLAMSIITTYTSASSFIGGPGVAYTLGLGWVLLAMIQVPTTFLTLGLMGKRLAAFSRATGAVTISDFLRARYGSKTLVTVTNIFMLIFFVAIMLAQFIGGARLFQATTGVPYAAGLFLFGITVIGYTSFGGFRAVVLTDLVQGGVMLLASVLILFGVIKAGGGLPAIMDKLALIDPGLLQPTGAAGKIQIPFLLSFWVLVGFGVLGLPQTAQKCMAFRDDASLRQAMVVGTIVIGFTLLCTHLAGALGRAVLPDLPVGDLVMPTLIMELMPPFLAGIFVAGVLAAIMSTVSSMLIMTSATIIRDLYIAWYLQGNQEKTSPQFVRRASFAVTAVLGALVFVLALNPPDLLVWINLFAFGGLEAVFLWPVVLGLYWNKANATGALAAVWIGVVVFLGLSIVKVSMGGVHPIVPSILLSGAAFWIGTMFSSRQRVAG